MRRLLLNTLKELGYEGVGLDPTRCEQREIPGRAVPCLWEQEAVALCRQHHAAAVVVDPVFGMEGIPELQKLCPGMPVIACGVELNPALHSHAARIKRTLLDAGAPAMVALNPSDPAPALKEALDKAL